MISPNHPAGRKLPVAASSEPSAGQSTPRPRIVFDPKGVSCPACAADAGYACKWRGKVREDKRSHAVRRHKMIQKLQRSNVLKHLTAQKLPAPQKAKPTPAPASVARQPLPGKDHLRRVLCATRDDGPTRWSGDDHEWVRFDRNREVWLWNEGDGIMHYTEDPDEVLWGLGEDPAEWDL